MRVANRLTAAMGPLFEIEGRDVNVRASVGVAAGRPGLDTAGDLLRNADVAMYSAKARGKGRVVVFEPSMHDAVMARAQLSADLEHAIGGPRVRAPVPADRRDRDRPDGRRRGARPLGASRARPDRAGRLHPRRRGVRFDPRDRPLGARPGLPAGCASWQRRSSAGRRSRSASTSRPGSSPSPTSSTRSSTIIREAGVDAGQIVARDDRDVDAPGQRRDATRSCRTCATRGSASRSTTSGPATRRSATSSGSRSRCSRSPATSWTSTAPTPSAWELASAIVGAGPRPPPVGHRRGRGALVQLGRLRTLGCGYAQGFYFARPSTRRDRDPAGQGDHPGGDHSTCIRDAAGPPGDPPRPADRRRRPRRFRFRRAPNRTFLPLARVPASCIVGVTERRPLGRRQTVCKLGKPAERAIR